MKWSAVRSAGFLVALCCASAAAAQRVCTGDCGGDAGVTVDEIAIGTNIALGEQAIDDCTAFDRDGGDSVEVDELVAGITYALDGCPLTTVADAAFWQTLQGVQGREDEVLQLYAQAIADNPADARSHFLLGMMHFYRFGRAQADFENFSAVAQGEIVAANEALDLAVMHAPENRAYPGFRGGASYMNGVAHGDPAVAEIGLQRLRASIELWPLFNRFSFLGTVAATAAAGTPLFAEALAHLEDALSPAGLFECTGRLCGNEGLAPHNLEGSGLLFGDIFAKGGNVSQARGWYQLSANLGAGSGWPFTALSRERADNVETRVALYQDEDPSNDPLLAGLGAENCAICHYK